jgi:hypothetical protein
VAVQRKLITTRKRRKAGDDLFHNMKKMLGNRLSFSDKVEKV